MESELSGIFRVKLVTKNMVRGSPGTQFMHMRVKHSFTEKLHGVEVYIQSQHTSVRRTLGRV